MIAEYPNTLQDHNCSFLLKHREELKGNSYEDVVEWMCDTKYPNLYNYIYELIQPNVQDYINKYNPELSIELDGIGIIRQPEGAYDNLHTDTPLLKNKHDEIILRPFVCLVYLNDDFEGGELVFPTHKQTIKPEQGKMVMFPASWMYPHFVLPIGNGERYFIRFNFKINDPSDKDVDQWDITKDGIMQYD